MRERDAPTVVNPGSYVAPALVRRHAGGVRHDGTQHSHNVDSV